MTFDLEEYLLFHDKVLLPFEQISAAFISLICSDLLKWISLIKSKINIDQPLLFISRYKQAYRWP